MAQNFGYTPDYNALYYGGGGGGGYVTGFSSNIWQPNSHQYGQNFGDKYSRTWDRDLSRVNDHHRHDRSHGNGYTGYHSHGGRDGSRGKDHSRAHPYHATQAPSSGNYRHQEGHSDHGFYGNQYYGNGGMMSQPVSDARYNSYQRGRGENDHHGHVSSPEDNLRSGYTDSHNNRYTDKHDTSRGQTQDHSGREHQGQYSEYPSYSQGTGPKHDPGQHYDGSPSNHFATSIQVGGDLEHGYDGSNDNEAVRRAMHASPSSQGNSLHDNRAVTAGGFDHSDSAPQTSYVTGQLNTVPSTSRLRTHPDKNKHVKAGESTTAVPRPSKAHSKRREKSKSKHGGPKPEVMASKAVDFPKAVHLRRRWASNRQSVMQTTTENTAEVAFDGEAHTAQQFIKLYRQHVKEGREQLIDQKTKNLAGVKKYKYQMSKKTRSPLGGFFSQFEIWRRAFKTVEGNFGASVVAYFRFVKWLFLINLFTFALIAATIVVPHELLEPDSFVETVDGLEADTGYNHHLDAAVCSAEYTHTIEEETEGRGIGFQILYVFLGTGWMEETMLFIGYYFNKTYYFEPAQGNGSDPVMHGEIKYNLPIAYLLTTFAYLILILILMVNYTGEGVKDRLVNSGDKFNRCCNMVFCGWDYNLMTEKAVQLKHRNLSNEFANDIAEARREKKRKAWKQSKKVCLFIVRLLVWTFVLACWGASFYFIGLVVDSLAPGLQENETVQDNWILTLVVEFLPSITITAINAVAAPLFQIIVKLEKYTPETEVRVTIARTVTLRLASVGVLSFTLHARITQCESDEMYCGNCRQQDQQQEGGESMYNLTRSAPTPDTSSSLSHCWENYVGQEYYKLVVVDFFVIVGNTFFVDFPRRVLVKCFPKTSVISKIGLQEFELPKNVLDIVYTQTISWIGGFFSPLIPAITAIKLFIFFYVKKLTLMKNCIPASRNYRASKSNYFFMIILMVSYGLSLFVLAFAIGKIPPSKSCGPWRVYSKKEYYMYTSITDTFELLPNVVKTVFDILNNWVLYVILLITLCLITYYYQAISSGNKRKVQLLKEQLALEGMDKQYLMRQVNVVLQGTTIKPINKHHNKNPFLHAK